MKIQETLYNGKGFVEIVDVIPGSIPEGFRSRDAEIVNNARICTKAGAPLDDFQVYDFIEKLFKMGHYSPFEQATLKFRIKAPYVVWSQIDRHRSFVYSSQLRRSGRYAEFSEEDFYIPENFGNPHLRGEEYLKGEKEFFKLIITNLTTVYKELIQSGVPKESARFVLPAFCLMYEDLVTVNLKNLFHFFALRNSKHAQREIRELASMMMQLTKVLFPYSIKIFMENVKAVNYDFNEI